MSTAQMTEHDLPPQQKNLWLKGVSAYQLKNYDYAISLILSVVKQTPEFLAGRRLLRSAEGEKAKNQKKSFLGGVKLPALKSSTKKEPWEGIAELEETVFQKDPYNISGNQALYDFATRIAQTDLAAFALETLREGHPENTRNLHKLAEHYLTHDQPEKASDVYRQILRVDATDMDAIKGEKDSAAANSIKTQGWGGGGGFRGMIKDADQNSRDENASRIGASKEQLEAVLAQYAADYERDPNNINVVKKIADTYERLENLDAAYSYYDWALQLNPADVSLQARVENLRDRMLDAQISQTEKEIESEPDAPDIEEKRAQLRAAKQQRGEAKITEARAKVDRNPTDKQYRFDLATVLYLAEYYREAIPELQQAKSNPHIRNRALLMLGKCFSKLNMFDLAVNAFAEAVKELVVFNAEKKELLYSLGLTYEKVGKKEEYLNCMKEIYNNDYAYLDVATRVESSYQ